MRLGNALCVLFAGALTFNTVASTPLYAHGTLRTSTPAKGEHLIVAPRELGLTFSEPYEWAYARVELVGPFGPVQLGRLLQPEDSSSVLRAPIQGGLLAGVYTVKWQIAGADGHPVRGEYTFVIAPGAAGLSVAPVPGQAPPPTGHHPQSSFPEGKSFDAGSPLYGAIRWLMFVGLVGTLGVVSLQLVLALLRRQNARVAAALIAPARRRAITLGLWLTALTAAAALLRLIAQSYALHGSANAFQPALIGTMLTRTLWGWGWLLQFLATFIVLAGLWLARRKPIGWFVAAVGAMALAVTPALSGHAAVVPRLAPLPVVTDAIHIMGAGGWLGGLFAVLFAGIPAAMSLPPEERGSAVAALVNAFSPTALFFAAATVATGVFAAWLHLGSVTQLWESTYGRTLLIKLAVLSGVFGTGAYNWLKVRPALGDDLGVQRIRRSASVELIIGAVVIAITAILVATAPPMTD